MNLSLGVCPSHGDVLCVCAGKTGSRAVAKEDPQPTKTKDVVRYEVSALSLEQVRYLGFGIYLDSIFE